jgi:hypothetical protein
LQRVGAEVSNMSRLITPLAGASAGLLAALAWSLPSLADEPSADPDATAIESETATIQPESPAIPQQPQPAKHDRPPINHARTGAALVLSGLAFMGLSYGPSLYVANRSGLPSDHRLDVPIAGPWMDLASRPACAGYAERGCGNEPGYTALLVLDGFIQAVATIQILAGLGELATDDSASAAPRKKTSGTAIVVTPAALGTGGYGLGALGKF